MYRIQTAYTGGQLSTSVNVLHELNEYTVPKMLWNMATFIKIVNTTKVVTKIKGFGQCRLSCQRKLNMRTLNNTPVWAKTDWLCKAGLLSLWYKHSYSFKLHHIVFEYTQKSFFRQTGNMTSTHPKLGTLLQFLLILGFFALELWCRPTEHTTICVSGERKLLIREHRTLYRKLIHSLATVIGFFHRESITCLWGNYTHTVPSPSTESISLLLQSATILYVPPPLLPLP